MWIDDNKNDATVGRLACALIDIGKEEIVERLPGMYTGVLLPLKSQKSFAIVKLLITQLIERFAFEYRKVIGFAITTLRDWL